MQQQTQLCYFVNNLFSSNCLSAAQKCCLVAKVPIFGALMLRKSKFILTLYWFVLSFNILQNVEFKELEHIRIFDVSARRFFKSHSTS